jgi:four helix bundle protein
VSTAKEMQERTKAFAIRVLGYTRAMPRTMEARGIARQLVRCGTSVGANYRAACLARSKADFVAKLGIVLEEADESKYWLELLAESGFCKDGGIEELAREAGELTSILVASIKTARGLRT